MRALKEEVLQLWKARKEPIEAGNEGLVDQNSASGNHVVTWLDKLAALRSAAS